MEIVNPLVKQVLIMFMLAMAGMFCYYKKWIDNEGSRQLSSFLLQFVMPIIVIVSYQKEFEVDKLLGLGMALAISAITFVVTIGLAQTIFKKKAEAIFGVVFSNASFFSIPIVMAVLGNEAVFYLSAYLICFNVLTWTYGVTMMSGDKSSLSLKKAILNPGVIGVILGLILFISPVKLPALLFQTMQSIAGLNTPLAMMVFGIFLAQTELHSLFSSKEAWMVAVIRLLVVPVLIVLLFILVPSQYEMIKLAVLLACSAPVGISTVLFARQFDRDFMFSTKVVGLSTILSIVTIPAIILLAQRIW